jgi:hypothetical protein
VGIGFLQELRISEESVTPSQRAGEKSETYGAHGVAKWTGVKGGARVVDGFFEGGEIFVVGETVVQDRCDAQLGQWTQGVVRGQEGESFVELHCRSFAVVVQAALLEAYVMSDAVKDAELGYCLAGRAFSISSKSLSTCLLSVLCSL